MYSLLWTCLVKFTLRCLLSPRSIHFLGSDKSPLGLSIGCSANLQALDALDLLEFGQILYDFMSIEQLAIQGVLEKDKESLSQEHFIGTVKF